MPTPVGARSTPLVPPCKAQRRAAFWIRPAEIGSFRELIAPCSELLASPAFWHCYLAAAAPRLPPKRRSRRLPASARRGAIQRPTATAPHLHALVLGPRRSRAAIPVPPEQLPARRLTRRA